MQPNHQHKYKNRHPQAHEIGLALPEQGLINCHIFVLPCKQQMNQTCQGALKFGSPPNVLCYRGKRLPEDHLTSVRCEEKNVYSAHPIKVKDDAEVIYETACKENLQKDEERDPLSFVEFDPGPLDFDD